jgi:hypothetical protein
MQFCNHTTYTPSSYPHHFKGGGIFAYLPAISCDVQVTFVVTYSLVAIIALIFYLIYKRELNQIKKKQMEEEKKRISRLLNNEII